MDVIAEFAIVPIGVGVSLSAYVAECERILQERHIDHKLHANGTNLEGDWDEVMEAIKACVLRVHEMGVPRISTTIKIGTRTDRQQTMGQKVASVEEKI